MSKTYEAIDVELIVKAQQGDEAAFEAIYLKYYKNVYYLCYQYFKEQGKAEDAVQDTFVAVYKYLKNLEKPETFFVWMSKIAYNCCNGTYRKANRDASSYVNESDDDRIFDEFAQEIQIDHISEMQQKEAVEIIRITLDEMKPDFRLLGYLYFFEQLSYKEISDITEVTMGTVSSRVNRIKGKLKTTLEKCHFTKETCMSMVLMPNMASIYRESIAMIPASAPGKLKGSLLVGSHVSFNHAVSKLMIASLIALPVGGMLFYSLQQDTLEKPKIQNVTYDTTLTNLPVPIHVEVSDKYDSITLDDQSDLTLYRSGKHSLKLYEGKTIVDTYNFHVSNIDIEAPDAEQIETSTHLRFILRDNEGIKYEGIKVTSKQMQPVYELQRENHTLLLDKSQSGDVKISIPDYAGNTTTIDITLREVEKR